MSFLRFYRSQVLGSPGVLSDLGVGAPPLERVYTLPPQGAVDGWWQLVIGGAVNGQNQTGDHRDGSPFTAGRVWYFYLDRVAPVITSLNHVLLSTTTTEAMARIEATVQDVTTGLDSTVIRVRDALTGTVVVSISFDGNGTRSEVTYSADIILEEGVSYEYDVVTTDRAGHVSTDLRSVSYIDPLPSYTCLGDLPQGTQPTSMNEMITPNLGAIWTYREVDSPDKCEYKCLSGYTWTGDKCIGSSLTPQ